MESDKSQEKIYLDYAAGTPTDPDVVESMLPYYSPFYSNASSIHQSGMEAKAVIEQAREDIAHIINSQPEEIIFTGSGTESDNLAIIGVARAHKHQGNHIIISAVEHKAVIESARQLEKEGFDITILPVNRFGTIDIHQCIRNIRKETVLISVIYANNEIGTVEPIQELAKLIKKRRQENGLPLLHTDACQAAGYLSIDVEELGVDLMTLNSSKIYGPKGVGMLFKRSGVRISPLIIGGDQEHHIRAGTESLPLITGFATALKKAETSRFAESGRLRALQYYFMKNLKELIPGLTINGELVKRLPNNVHVSIPRVEGESMLLMLDMHGIEVSTGSACSSFNLKPSHVLIAIGQDEKIMHGSIRFTMGKYTTKAEIDKVLGTFPQVIERLASMSAVKNI